MKEDYLVGMSPGGEEKFRIPCANLQLGFNKQHESEIRSSKFRIPHATLKVGFNKQGKSDIASDERGEADIMTGYLIHSIANELGVFETIITCFKAEQQLKPIDIISDPSAILVSLRDWEHTIKDLEDSSMPPDEIEQLKKRQITVPSSNQVALQVVLLVSTQPFAVLTSLSKERCSVSCTTRQLPA